MWALLQEVMFPWWSIDFWTPECANIGAIKLYTSQHFENLLKMFLKCSPINVPEMFPGSWGDVQFDIFATF
jgi:hypothetical protein